MPSRTDAVAVAVALAGHVAIAWALLRLPALPLHHGPSVVELEVHNPRPRVAPPPITPPAPPKEPPLRHVVQKRRPHLPPPATPPPNREPPKTPPKEPPKPVFGVTADSTVKNGDTTVPVGNTTMIDPTKSGLHTGPASPLPPANPGPARPSVHAVSALYIKSYPDIDSDACGRSVAYPEEAEELGIEGDVKLRVSLDEKGHVIAAKVLSGLGHGLDRAAAWALTHKCRFTPAIATDGKPVAYTIPAYVFHFEIPR